MTVSEYRMQLLGVYNAGVLGDISRQVQMRDPAGLLVTYPPAYWHEWFKRRLNRGLSTTVLDDQQYSEYVRRVEVFAASHMGVEFTERKTE